MKRTRSANYVYLIEDDDSLRRSLARGLNLLGFDVYEFESAEAFLLRAKLFRPAVVVLDMQMPGMTGVQLQAALNEKNLAIPIIFISGESTVSQSIKAMKQGALDFLPKPFDLESLVQLIDVALQKDQRLQQAQASKQSGQSLLAVLKPRELEAYLCLAKGYSYLEIMASMQISLPTAKQYRTAVMRKMKFDSLSALIAFHRALSEPES